MYELLILGALMQRDMSGYKLRHILQNTLVPRRPVSNGIIYPVMKKLAEGGYIELYDETESDHDGKMARITAKGVELFKELMVEPVEMNAKRDSIYSFKLRSLFGVAPAQQRQILVAYRLAVEDDLNSYQGSQAHLRDLIEEHPDRRTDIESSMKNIELGILVSQTRIDWLTNEINKLES